MSKTSETLFPDANGDGIPDAFEHRLPISEVLNTVEKERIANSLVLEIELEQRPPEPGELILLDGSVQRIRRGSALRYTIVRRVLSAPPGWQPD